jgi:hypothetical protein
MKQDVAGKIGEPDPAPVTRSSNAYNKYGQPLGGLNPVSELEQNRRKARGLLAGGLGDFVNGQQSENPSSPTGIERVPSLYRKEGQYAHPTNQFNSPSTTQGIQLPLPAQTSSNLIELVYRNNAEAQRSYLDFSPY